MKVDLSGTSASQEIEGFFLDIKGMQMKTKSLVIRGPCNCDGILICRTLHQKLFKQSSKFQLVGWVLGGYIILQEHIYLSINTH